MNSRSRSYRKLGAAAAAVGVLAAIAVPSLADHGLPHPELLGRGTFIDKVSVAVRNKQFRRRPEWVFVKDSSDIVVLRITIEAGGVAPWHNHTGVGFLTNLGPGVLTNYLGDDCEPRLFYPGDAFIDPGHDELHAVRNDSNQEIVILATFVGIEDAPVLPEPAPEACAHVL